MKTTEYYEDDIIRIINTDEFNIYIFEFLGDSDDIYKIHDSEYDGENSDDHANYVDSRSEIAFLFSPYDDPAWPVTVEYNDG